MKKNNLISLLTFFFVTGLFCACTESSDSVVKATPTPSSVSSSSAFSFSSSNTAISSSENADYSTFSKYFAQLNTSNEVVIDFDPHVVAMNEGTLSPSCEESMLSYDENELIIPLKSISTEDIAECFHKTAPHLIKKFSAEKDIVKFYAVIEQLHESPQIAILNKFTENEIIINIISPKDENCNLTTWGVNVIFLIADTENIIKDNTQITYKHIQNNSWVCDEKGNPSNIKTGGEWFNDSLL